MVSIGNVSPFLELQWRLYSERSDRNTFVRLLKQWGTGWLSHQSNKAGRSNYSTTHSEFAISGCDRTFNFQFQFCQNAYDELTAFGRSVWSIYKDTALLRPSVGSPFIRRW